MRADEGPPMGSPRCFSGGVWRLWSSLKTWNGGPLRSDPGSIAVEHGPQPASIDCGRALACYRWRCHLGRLTGSMAVELNDGSDRTGAGVNQVWVLLQILLGEVSSGNEHGNAP